MNQAEWIATAWAGVIVAIALILLLRVVLRREPAPPTWRRYRLGVFLERDPKDDEREVKR